jgi:hypothetical protein
MPTMACVTYEILDGQRDQTLTIDGSAYSYRRSSPPSVANAPARCGAFADERRIVAGDEGGRVGTRNAHPVLRAVRLIVDSSARRRLRRHKRDLTNICTHLRVFYTT